MKAYSMDLRERIVAACAKGESQVSVAQRFGVCSQTVSAYVGRAARGQLPPLPIPGRVPRLRPEQEEAFVAMMGATSDWTLEQLSLEWERRRSGAGAAQERRSGVLLPRSTLHDHRKRLGARFKKRVASPKNVVR